jgi:hypothetical protein
MAGLGHFIGDRARECSARLVGSILDVAMSAFDPKRTLRQFGTFQHTDSTGYSTLCPEPWGR